MKKLLSILLTSMFSLNMAMAQGIIKRSAPIQNKSAQTTRKQSSSTVSKPKTGNHNGYEYVDLGLSVKWATCNVGASKPWEYGDYYAWGETETKSDYCWKTYKYCKGTKTSMTKYCKDSEYGTVDNKTLLDPEDDVAHVKWGGNWRIPTKAERDELRYKCKCNWTTQNGVKGYKITSKKNGNSIFLPAAGYCDFNVLNSAGSKGYYWSSSSISSDPNYACHLYFASGDVDWSGSHRCLGHSVRPVCP